MRFSLKKKLNGANEAGEMNLDVSCQLARGTFAAIYGPSGAGKTSILRMLAGLLDPDEGFIEIDGEVWLDSQKKLNRKPQHREVGYVFQEYALFPNMSVRRNLEYGLEKGEDKRRVDELIEIIELGNLQHRKPTTLSGGQKQRVALARAVIRKPQLLLMDEPLSALDAGIRVRLQDYLRMIHEAYEMTTLLVSHDLPEIYRLCEEVILLEEGSVIKQGSPGDVFGSGTFEPGVLRFSGEVVKVWEAGESMRLSVWGKFDHMELEISRDEASQIKQRDKVEISVGEGEYRVRKLD